MPINVETFLSLPDLETNLKSLKKEDLTVLAAHFEIDVTNKRKDEIKSLIHARLEDEGLLQPAQEINEENSDKEDATSEKFKMELEMKKLELQLQLQEKLELRKLDLAIERERMESQERIEIERLRAQQHVPQLQQDSRFDPARNIRLVPKFNERSVDKYFPQFEKVAENLK